MVGIAVGSVGGTATTGAHAANIIPIRLAANNIPVKRLETILSSLPIKITSAIVTL
jgi:hypothetical protein